MRFLRVLMLTCGLASLASTSSAAQEGRLFKDSWFWGLKAGALTYASSTTSNGGAPMVGGEWLITRTQGGLYVSLDQAFLSTTGGFVDHSPDSAAAFVSPVNLTNMRRFTIAGTFFPGATRDRHPYFGVGLAINQIASASLVYPSTTDAHTKTANDSIQSKKASFAPVLLGGVQFRKKSYSVFAQGTASLTSQRFFLSNPTSSRGFDLSIEAGVRYNAGSSIDRAH